MAKTYRTERDILTIDLTIEISPNKLPEGVAPEKSSVLKISAFPAVWNWLLENKDDRQQLDEIIDKALQDASNKMPLRLQKQSDINENDFHGAFASLATKEKRIAKGLYYRGTHKKKKDITNEIKKFAPLLHWLFRCWKDDNSRQDCVQSIYEKRKEITGRATNDPTKMTYFCCGMLYGKELADRGEQFPTIESFRTTYLTGKHRFRRPTTEEEIIKTIEKQPPLAKKLAFIVENCTN